MSSGATIFMLGIICVIGPVVQAIRDGVLDDGDFIHWLLGKSIETITTMQALVWAGLLLMTVGVARAWQ